MSELRTSRYRYTDDPLAERVRTNRHSRRISDESSSVDRIRPSRVSRSVETGKVDHDENMNERHSRLTEDTLSDRVRTSRTNRRISDEYNGVERVRRTRTRTADDADTERPRTYRSSRSRTEAINKDCEKCIEKQEQIAKLEQELAIEKDNNVKQMSKLENELNEAVRDRDDFAKEIKKLQKEVNKINKNLDEESVQNRRLTIKLEDANYEIGRLRQELINSQLENEKIVEENEDLAVDNEDLIKERDEIIQIYDELFHESERLKRELNIWKTVVENNIGNLPSVNLEDNGDANENEDLSQKNIDGEKEDEIEDDFELEEDQSLLVPPRNDIRIKATEVSKAFVQNDEIARGKFGKVYKMTARATGDTYAAKYIKVTPKLREDVLNTIDVMKKIHHTRLMNIFDVYDQGTQIVMILEYVGGGMLFERIVEKNFLTEAECALHIKQILQGLHHLHRQHIAHLDLKPENIVCVNRNSMDIKIIDFGLAKQLDVKKDIKITAGSPEFVAPEILSFDPVCLNSDLWSVGVIAYVLLSGISPFIGEDDNDTLLNVSCGEYEYDETAFQNITNDAKSFIDNLLVSCPKKRPNVSRCLQDPWITTNWQAKQNEIDLENMKKFLEKRKEKGNVSAVRAIRRFSSFGVGLLNPRGAGGGPLQRTPSKHLLVPNALQSSIIEEGEEESEDDENQNIKNINSCLLKGPTFTVTKDEHSTSEKSRPCSGEVSPDIPENTDTPDGLRNYLQRMINSGMLPGRSGPPELEHSDEKR